MHLATYLDLHGLSDGDFAEQIGTSRQVVHRYRTGQRIPDRAAMERIGVATKGAVAPNDFFKVTDPTSSQPEEAA